MGSCFSAASRAAIPPPPPARVIAPDGSLKEYFPPVKAGDVLSGSQPRPCFLCSSDSLYLDARIPATPLDESLQAGQIYFLLPSAMQRRSLSHSDMAALLARASSALERGRGSGRGRRRIQVAPVTEPDYAADGVGGGDISKSDRLARTASRRHAVLQRRVKKRLDTIPEVAE